MKMQFIRIPVIILFICSFLPLASAEETLTWQDCLAEAKKNHPDLISAQESINQQKAGKEITASGLYPQISSNLSTSTAKSATSGATADSYSYGVSGSQLIFDGLKTINDINAAKENIKSAQQGYRFTSSAVRLNLRSAFINLLTAQELIRVAEEIVKIRRDNLVLITLRYESGLEHRGALLTAEADVAAAKLGLDQAKREMVLAQRQLTKEMGRKEFTPMSVSGDFVVRDTVEDKPDLNLLAASHPSLLQLEAKKNAASFAVKSAYADFAPQISGSAGAGKTSSRWPPQNSSWSLGLGLVMPIFEGGLRLAQVSKAKAAYIQADADERSTKDGIVVTLEQSWDALQNALETVEVQRKTLEAAEERSKIAEAQYSTGFISYDNWSIIEDNLVTYKRAYLNAESNALLAEASLIYAKGETLEYAQ
jgi:outer membrane protein TolC